MLTLNDDLNADNFLYLILCVCDSSTQLSRIFHKK